MISNFLKSVFCMRNSVAQMEVKSPEVKNYFSCPKRATKGSSFYDLEKCCF